MARKTHLKHVADADLKLLRVFKAVAESGGLAAAESELNIGKSTISKYIADLELRLDLKLCNRGPAGFSLTDDGAKVLRSAEGLLISVADFRAEVNEIKQQLAGTIRIALFDQCASNPEAFVPGGIRAFNKAAPAVEIDLSLEPPNVIETKVISGQLDIGILALHRPSPSLDYMPLYGENMFLYCGKGHPFMDRDLSALSLSDVQAMNYAGIRVNSPNLHVGQTLGFRRAAKVQNEQALAILIMSGSYLGFLPDHMAEGYIRKGLMKAVLPEEIRYRSQFAAVTRRRPAVNRITKLFLDTLTAAHSLPAADALLART
ncbi:MULTISPECIES: LysR family transcriptional regulator [unclassified Leisingera]|uniref:LysR family transcriptional regulator n=1 Tax=unclassified Leisingera TaxID=2614906 RepID=UPI0002EA846D|nr:MULTISPECIES: LysR family transcriptional regulator [unclassified Leisingera]KIC17251.1 LysR family transcriptional regulator [Leisingera sp. ANG-DT]KIC26818.1 LysR family transcriptional regulator [Leisingera sp. ANG-S3]KIC49499.1 LysR family transcriptional regulator [Leisingera sp. ANG-S]KID07115.1 LysR family transcriptional regulator [Leisingera sp. ANG1]